MSISGPGTKTKEYVKHYVYFQRLNLPRKTSVWRVMTMRDDIWLGEIKWFGRWRQYCFFPQKDTVFSEGCMSDIEKFIRSLMEGRRKSVSRA